MYDMLALSPRTVEDAQTKSDPTEDVLYEMDCISYELVFISIFP